MSAATGTSGYPTELPRAELIRRLAISESGFVFDPVSGHSFVTNETACAVLRLLQQNTQLEQILRSLQQDYDASPRELERDVLEFIGSLRKQLNGL